MTSEYLSPHGHLREASVAELLEDPIMHLLLRRDGLRVEEVADFLATARRRFREAGRPTTVPPCVMAAIGGSARAA